MDSLERIGRFLAAVRRRVRHVAGVTATLYALAAVLAAGLIAPLLAWGLPGQARTIAITAAVLAGGVAAAAYVGGVAMPRRRFRRDEAVARLAGRRCAAPLSSDLLSAVELGASHAADSQRFSPHLVAALLDQTAEKVQHLEPAALVPSTPVRRASRVAVGAVAVYALALLLAPSALAAGWRLLVAPPEPGPFDGASLSEAPLVGDIDLTLTYPMYARRQPLRLPGSSGDFRAMPGTTVELTTRALEPAAAGRILLTNAAGEDRETIELVVDPATGTLRGSFTVTEPLSYRFLLEAPNRARRIEATPHRVEIEPDKAPTVELFAPAEELDVTSMKRIELAYLSEDDFGIARVDLVWEQDGRVQRKPLPVAEDHPLTAQSKFLWDLADVPLQPGVRVAYHIEVTDNDAVLGPNVGTSRQMFLRVFSPRERHEQNIERQRELFEKMVRNLGGRLVVALEDLEAHQLLGRDTAQLVVEIGTLVAALDDDELADAQLRQALEEMRGRLDELVGKENELVAQMLDRQRRSRSLERLPTRLAASDAALVAELEDDVLLLADWVDRQQMQSLLAIQDEIDLHKKRLEDLFAEYERTGNQELLAEIEREMKAIEKLLAEMGERRQGLAEDVLDRFVNSEAMQADEAQSCMSQVRELLATGDAAAAQQKMKECMDALDQSAMAMEQALAALRGDKFSEEERKFGELMNELADLARDQNDLADAADELWQRYADRADELMRDKAREMRKQLSRTLDKLRQTLDTVPADGLTPFSKEELELVRSRVADLDRMLADGDIAEALAMARQAEASLETMASELQAAAEEQSGPWSKRTEAAAARVDEALPLAAKLVDELEAASPSPDQIMSGDDRKRLEQLRRRQQSVRERSDKLAERAEQMAGELPGSAGQEIAGGVRKATEQMRRAEGRMKARDPSGTRQEARGAAEALDKTRESARGAARQQQRSAGGGLRDEPVRIPGAEDYKAPEKFREDILEAMKKERPPEGFDELVRRYYEELIR